MIPQDFIQSLLARVDVVDVINQHVPLKRAGANFIACCPFHGEKTPSFTVSPTKQFYHCFGCGVHGTAISFLIEHDGLSFVEAVKHLAGLVGMQVPESQSPSFAQTSSDSDINIPALYDALRTAMHFFREQLKTSATAIDYLKRRGITGEIAAKYALGYAPEGWQSLQQKFPDYRSSVLLKAGLVIDSQEGRRYDRFRDRIMFPIFDAKGNVIAFGGRVLDSGEPKYLNSPETPVFEKGRELYGLMQARRAIREHDEIIVVEGYMDVVALSQHGVENAVATLGTATTNIHVQKLLKQVDHIIFSFDGDKAGHAAAWRALENSLSELSDRKRISFLFLPDGHDPDSFIRENGRDVFVALLKDATPLSEFLIRKLQTDINLRTDEGRGQLIEMARPLILSIKAPILSLQLRKRLAELVRLSQTELDQQYDIRPMRKVKVWEKQKSKQRMSSSSRRLLKCLIAEPSLVNELNGNLPQEYNVEADSLPGIIDIMKVLNASGHLNSGALIYAFADTIYKSLVEDIQQEILMEWEGGFDVKAEFQKILEDVEKNELEEQIDLLEKKLAKHGLDGVDEQDKLLYKQLIAARVR